MTVTKCPHGCGGFVNTAKDNYCPSCRRDLAAVDIVMPNGAKTEDYGESNCMTAHKPEWCWEWWGPADHRMRCRLPKAHEGEHDTHEQRQESMIVSTQGELIR